VIPDYDATIRLQPNYAEAFCNRGFAHLWKKELEAAIADATEAIWLKPNYPDAYFIRGCAYARKAWTWPTTNSGATIRC
jgi:tetratricopeptide (TPR) repeat protein